MKNTADKTFLTIDERAYQQLLAGSGEVRVRINRVGQYFVPFVYFSKCDTDEPEPRGLIMRNRDLLGAKSTKDLLDVLNDISAGIGPVNVDKSVGVAN